jgi:hypothetical protein
MSKARVDDTHPEILSLTGMKGEYDRSWNVLAGQSDISGFPLRKISYFFVRRHDYH